MSCSRRLLVACIDLENNYFNVRNIYVRVIPKTTSFLNRDGISHNATVYYFVVVLVKIRRGGVDKKVALPTYKPIIVGS